MFRRLFQAPLTPSKVCVFVIGVILMLNALMAVDELSHLVDDLTSFYNGQVEIVRKDGYLLFIEVMVPPKVMNDESFLVTVTTRLIDETPENKTLRNDSPADSAAVQPDRFLDQFKEPAMRGIRYEDIAYTLSIAGATIDPHGNNTASPHGIVKWSARIERPGRYVGVIRPEVPTAVNRTADGPRIFYEPVSFAVDVEPRFIPQADHYTIVFRVVTAFFGSLLTLPGILSYLDQRRKARIEQQAEEEKRRPKVITDLTS